MAATFQEGYQSEIQTRFYFVYEFKRVRHENGLRQGLTVDETNVDNDLKFPVELKKNIPELNILMS